jgi:hypothetical protein
LFPKIQVLSRDKEYFVNFSSIHPSRTISTMDSAKVVLPPSRTISTMDSAKIIFPTKKLIRVKLMNGEFFDGEFISSNDSAATYQSSLGFVTIRKSMILSLQAINSVPSSNATGSTPYSKKIIARNPTSVALKFCIDLAGSHKVSAMGQSGSMDVNTGVSIGLEVGRRSEEMFNFAVGFTYLIPREQVISGSGKFNFMPIYAVGKFRLNEGEESIVPILIGNLGYDVLFNGDTNYKGPFSLSGGLYIAGGLRLEIDQFFLEGLFKSFGGSAKYDSGTTTNIDVTYTTFSLAFGVLL